MIQLEISTSNNWLYGYSVAYTESGTVEKLDTVSKVVPINDTKFWEWYGRGVALEGDDLVIAAEEYSEEPVLLNSYGKSYPIGYEDPQSGISLYIPPANLAVNVQQRNSTYKKDMERNYEANWGKPTEFTWDQVDAHHMRPLKYGGSNAVSNLIPLMNYNNSHPVVLKHSYLTRWWYYY